MRNRTYDRERMRNKVVEYSKWIFWEHIPLEGGDFEMGTSAPTQVGGSWMPIRCVLSCHINSVGLSWIYFLNFFSLNDPFWNFRWGFGLVWFPHSSTSVSHPALRIPFLPSSLAPDASFLSFREGFRYPFFATFFRCSKISKCAEKIHVQGTWHVLASN